ncbi:MAG: cytochrome c [Rhodobacter sp.]|nr:cytochrome c [Rhodobacter sp.]
MRFGLFLILALLPRTAVADELHLPQDRIEAGRSLFLEKCSKCHGQDASGGNAPDIQGILPKDVKEAARGVEAMPEIALEDVEAGHIAIFLMSLAPDQARLRLSIRRSRESSVTMEQ